jgi:hypothetical protein
VRPRQNPDNLRNRIVGPCGELIGVHVTPHMLRRTYANDPAGLARLRTTLAYVAGALTTPTGLFGESWTRLANGRIQPVQDMPDVWEHALFYMAALKIYGTRPDFPT